MSQDDDIYFVCFPVRERGTSHFLIHYIIHYLRENLHKAFAPFHNFFCFLIWSTLQTKCSRKIISGLLTSLSPFEKHIMMKRRPTTICQHNNKTSVNHTHSTWEIWIIGDIKKKKEEEVYLLPASTTWGFYWFLSSICSVLRLWPKWVSLLRWEPTGPQCVSHKARIDLKNQLCKTYCISRSTTPERCSSLLKCAPT